MVLIFLLSVSRPFYVEIVLARLVSIFLSGNAVNVDANAPIMIFPYIDFLKCVMMMFTGDEKTLLQRENDRVQTGCCGRRRSWQIGSHYSTHTKSFCRGVRSNY